MQGPDWLATLWQRLQSLQAERDRSQASSPESQVAPATSTPDEQKQQAAQSDTARAILADVREYFQSPPEPLPFDNRPSDQYIETQWFDFHPVATESVVDRYWVDKPFVHVLLLADDNGDATRYHVLTPTLTDSEAEIRAHLTEQLTEQARTEAEIGVTARPELRSTIASVITTRAAPLDPGLRHKLFYYLRRRYLGHGGLDPLMQDDRLEDISCTGSEVPIYVYHRDYADVQTTLQFTTNELEQLIWQLAQQAGEAVSAARPKVSGVLPDGSRIHVTLDADLARRGPNFTVRKFEPVQYSPVDLLDFGTFSLQQIALLWLGIEHNTSVLFAGPTASGKTTSLNAVSTFFRPAVKIISIELIGEIRLAHDNWVAYTVREATTEGADTGISMRDLLQAALHERPEYILVGEIRTESAVAQTFLSSIFTGHPGATTFHASSARNAVDRLTTDPIALPQRMPAALDLLAVQRRVDIGDDSQRTARRCVELVAPQWNGQLELMPITRWDPTTDSQEVLVDNLRQISLFDELSTLKGWSVERTLSELATREHVLRWLLNTDRTDMETVDEVTTQYHRSREQLLKRVYDDMGSATPPEWVAAGDAVTPLTPERETTRQSISESSTPTTESSALPDMDDSGADKAPRDNE